MRNRNHTWMAYGDEKLIVFKESKGFWEMHTRILCSDWSKGRIWLYHEYFCRVCHTITKPSCSWEYESEDESGQQFNGTEKLLSDIPDSASEIFISDIPDIPLVVIDRLDDPIYADFCRLSIMKKLTLSTHLRQLK